jgi:DNA-directed RNA polymerase subunit F
MNSKKNFFLGKNQERSDKMKDIDQSKIVDLGEDDDDLQNILEQENVIVDVDEQDKLLD